MIHWRHELGDCSYCLICFGYILMNLLLGGLVLVLFAWLVWVVRSVGRCVTWWVPFSFQSGFAAGLAHGLKLTLEMSQRGPWS